MTESRHADWQYFRHQIGVCPQWAYLDNAAVAPICRAAQNAVQQWAQQAAQQGVVDWSGWAEQVEGVRQLAAGLISAQPEEMALVPNTTTGISLIAEGFPWRDGDNVVIPAGEFPSNQYPWLNLQSRGVHVRRVAFDGPAVDLQRLLDACDERTRMLAISWVDYATGWRIDLDQLVDAAHQREIAVFVDAIQALGVFPLNVGRTPIDFAAADGHKWLLGPEGAGLLYVRRDWLDRLRPLNVGWNSVVHRHDFARIEMNLRPEAARYEGGSQNMVGFLGLGASLALLAELGLGPDDSPIADRVLALADDARQRLVQLGARPVEIHDRTHRSGIVTFDLPGRDLAAEQKRLLRAGVVVRFRQGRLRVSPHAYCNEEDLERLVCALRAAGF